MFIRNFYLGKHNFVGGTSAENFKLELSNPREVLDVPSLKELLAMSNNSYGWASYCTRQLYGGGMG